MARAAVNKGPSFLHFFHFSSFSSFQLFTILFFTKISQLNQSISGEYHLLKRVSKALLTHQRKPKLFLPTNQSPRLGNGLLLACQKGSYPPCRYRRWPRKRVRAVTPFPLLFHCAREAINIEASLLWAGVLEFFSTTSLSGLCSFLLHTAISTSALHNPISRSEERR